MNKSTKYFFTGLSLLTLSACNSSGDDAGSANVGTPASSAPPPVESVNLLGIWDYQFTQTGSICDGYYPRGKLQINSNNGDLTKIGTIEILGENVEVDSFGNCYLVAFNEVIDTSVGRPAVQTSDDYLAYSLADMLSDTSVVNYRVKTYKDDNITDVITYDNGVTLEVWLDR